MTLPGAVRRLFWDIDITTFEPTAFPQYTIERILELGDEDAVRWLWSRFPVDAITAALRNSRQLSPRSANFWALMLDLPRSEIRALRQAGQA